jgi:putative DNA primase/helicase
MTAPDNVVSTPARSGVPEVAGDHLNAQRFLDRQRGLVRRSPQLGHWYIWNGAWFQEDQLDQVLEMAADTIDDLRMWVAEADDLEEFKRRSRHYEASSRAGRREALLDVAGTDPDVVVSVEQLDSHPYLLACLNGTVDLRDGALRPASPADLLTRGVDVEYDPTATCARWESFISTTFNADSELIGFVQRLFGYCITGVIHDHVLPVLHGQGANGKSTLVGVIQDLLGDHAITAPDGLVIRHDHEPHPERIASLRGRRLVVSNELEAKAVLAEQTVKMLTGGDTLSARELYGRRFNFKPTHKVILVSNHKPKVHNTDHAIWRRIKLVPFEVIIPADQQDADLRRRFVSDHAPAILAWLVRGGVEWHRDGLGSAAAVDLATAEYKSTQDTLGAFLDECTISVGPTKTKVGELFNVWRHWCERSNDRPGRQQDFKAALEDHGFTLESYQNVKYVLGLGILGVGEAS